MPGAGVTSDSLPIGQQAPVAPDAAAATSTAVLQTTVAASATATGTVAVTGSAVSTAPAASATSSPLPPATRTGTSGSLSATGTISNTVQSTQSQTVSGTLAATESSYGGSATTASPTATFPIVDYTPSSTFLDPTATATLEPGTGGDPQPFTFPLIALVGFGVAAGVSTILFIFGLVMYKRRAKARAAQAALTQRMANFQDSFSSGGPVHTQTPAASLSPSIADPAVQEMEEAGRAARLAEIEAIRDSLRIGTTEVLDAVRVNRYSNGPDALSAPSPGFATDNGPGPISAGLRSPELPLVAATRALTISGGTGGSRTSLKLVNNYQVPQRMSSVLSSPLLQRADSAILSPRSSVPGSPRPADSFEDSSA